MKSLFAAIALAVTGFLSCGSPFTNNCDDAEPLTTEITLEPGKQYHGQGQIVGFEGTACLCCGGHWLVTAEADSVLFGRLPDDADFSFQSDEQYPIPVEYEFITDSSICWQVTRYVTLLSLKRI